MTLESRVRSKDSCPVWGGGVRKSAFQTVTRWRSTLLHVRFGEERQGNSPTTPCLLLYSGPGRASPTWRLSLTYSPALLWAGGCHRQWKQRSFWTRCNPIFRSSHTTPLSLRCCNDPLNPPSMYRWRTHSGCRKRSFWHRRAAQETLMIMPWRKASTAFTKRR